MRNIFRRSAEFAEKHKHHHHLFLAVLALAVAGTGAYTFRQEIVQAATYTLFQTSWSGGAGSTLAYHGPDANNQTSWSGYFNASTTISVGANDVGLLSASYSFTDDGTTSGDSPNASGGGFSNGVPSGTIVSGTGGAASVTMSQSGLLTALSPATIATGSGPRGVSISSNGTSVYVANNTSNTVSQYSRNTTTGLLTALSPATIAAASGPYGVAISPDGTSVYVTVTPSNSIRQYSRNTTTGLLTALSPATIATGGNPYGITISPDGTSVYVVNNDGTASQYSRNTTTGLLTALSPATIATGSTSRGITISPDGTSVYVANAGDYTVSQYSRNTTTGLLTALSPATVASGWGTWNITISPDGTSVYAADYSGNTVSQYSRNTTTGLLTALSPATIAVSGPYDITISPDGTSAYVVNYSGNTVSQYNRNTTTGLLTALSPATIAAGTGTREITISPDGTSVYAVNGTGNTVSQYSRVPYVSSGTFTSATIDFARPTIFTNMVVASTTPSGTSVSMKVRSSADGSTWADWDTGGCTATTAGTFTMSSLGCVTNGDRYIQYRATLSGTPSVVPALDSVTINDTQFSSTGGVLTSSKYDSGDATNQVSKITWTGYATSTTGETIKFQLRTASTAAGLDDATWCGYADTGASCTGSNYFEDRPTVGFGNGVAITDTSHPLRSGGDDRWVQYRVILASSGAISPVMESVTVQYVVNAAPVITITTPTVSQASDGTVTVVYTLEDSDTVSSGSYANKADITLQYCTSNCNTGNEVWADAVTVSGDVGAGVTLGANKTVVWTNPYTDYPSNYKPNTQKIRIKAYDGEGANHTGYSSASNTFILDTSLPVITSAVIDSSAGASTASGNTAGTITLTITDDSTKQYRLCNDIAFPNNDAQGNTCTWTTPLASTISGDVISSWVFTGANAAETVYIQARDYYNNTSAIRTNTAPAMPTDLRVADVSNPAADSFGETSSWVSVTNATSYDVEFATSVTEAGPAGSYTLRASPTSNIYPHSITVATTSAHWYRVRAVNANGDKSNFVTVTGGDIPNGFGTALPDSTAPTIDSSSVPTIKNTSANIIFETNELAVGQVYWGAGTTANAGTCTTATTPTTTYATSTSVWLSGLTSLTDYVYCFKVTDVLGNPSAILPGGTFRTVGGPVITNVTEREITDTSAVIFWNTSTSSTSWVKYATTATADAVANGTSVGSDTMVSESPTPGVIQHQVGLGVATPLTAGQTYYFQVTSTNSDGTTTDTNNGQYYKFVTLLDTSPPTITGTSTPVRASNAAVVVWQTSEPADGQLFYDTANHGTDTSLYPKYTQSQTPATSVKSIFHVMTLSSDYTNYGSGGGDRGLVASTPYYYVVKSSDTAGNTALSAGTFETPSDGNVTITVVAVSVAAPTGATPDTTAPAISNVKISDITPFGATVKFDTDEDTDGFIKYGKDTTYGDAAGDEAWAKTHTIKLRGLTLGTDYHIKVTAHDKAGNTGTSADQTFKTSFLSEDLKDLTKIENIEAFQKEIEKTIESILPSLVPPFIAKPIISDITESGATVTFKSNIKAFPVVVFAEDGAYDETKESPYTGEVSDTAEKATAHSLKLTGLKGNTKYHVQARGFSLPKVIGKSADVTFITKASKIAGSIVERKKDSFTVVWTTEQPTSSIVEYKDLKRGITGRKTDDAKKKSHSMKIENLPSGTAYEVNLSGITEQGNIAEAGSPLSVTTSTDTTPPAISGFKVDNALVPGRTDRIQTIVSWVTDEPGTSTAFYEEGAGTPGDTEELASKNEILDSYVTNHSVILPSLKPGTIYRLKVTSTDDSGNLGSFGPRTVITPKQTESITDIIFKNFEDSFKFLQKI